MKPPWSTALYAGLAILGIALPWTYNVQFLAAGGTPTGFLSAGFANPAVSSLSFDILIASTAFLVWMVMETRRLKMRHGWVYAVLMFSIAFAFAFPLFLFMRERRLKQLANEGRRLPGLLEANSGN
jgi:preprotein translocase subunit SecY